MDDFLINRQPYMWLPVFYAISKHDRKKGWIIVTFALVDYVQERYNVCVGKKCLRGRVKFPTGGDSPRAAFGGRIR